MKFFSLVSKIWSNASNAIKCFQMLAFMFLLSDLSEEKVQNRSGYLYESIAGPMFIGWCVYRGKRVCERHMQIKRQRHRKRQRKRDGNIEGRR